MDSIPDPFCRYIKVQDDQQFIACWWAVPVRLTSLGRIDTVVGTRNGFINQDPVPNQGLLILTDHGLVHCGELSRPGTYGMRIAGAQADVKIPRARMRRVDVVRRVAVVRPLLTVQVDGDAAPFSPQYLDGQVSGTDRIHFLHDEGTDMHSVLDQVHSALDIDGDWIDLVPPTTMDPRLPPKIICGYCGSCFNASDERCPNCGAPVEAPRPAAVTPPPP